jgi:radical SAM protein with 4Fe4S-binding SPASM domain
MMDCAPQAELGSSEYLSTVLGRVCKDRVPLSGAFDLTHRCNFRCVHCYTGHLAAQPRSQAAELSTKQVTELLAAATHAGCLMLLLSGGEPLLREDFIDIYKAAKRLGLIVTVFTNASLITQAHLDAFSEYPPHTVEVSVYAASDATYERITGARGSFGRVRRGIDQLMERGVRVSLKTMILRDNVDEVLAIEALARGLGVRFRLDPTITPRLNGDPKPLDQRVDPERAVAIEMATETRQSDMARFVERQKTSGGGATASTSRLYRCGAGIASFHIDPQGYMHPCLMSRAIAYNTSAMGFGPAWKAVTSAVDEAKWEGTGGCADCPNILLCGYCPGLFELEHASPSRPPEYVCRLGENRYRAVDPDRAEVVGVKAG